MATSIRLAPETEKRLNELSARTGRSKAYYLREAVEEYIDDMEDYYLAQAELKAIREGRARTYSLDEVKRELGLED